MSRCSFHAAEGLRCTRPARKGSTLCSGHLRRQRAFEAEARIDRRRMAEQRAQEAMRTDLMWWDVL